MLVSTDFQLVAFQASAFVRDQELIPSRVLRHVLQNWPQEYDGDPISIPTPAVFPPDVVAAQLASRDAGQRIEIARSRVNLFESRVGDEPLDFGEATARL